MLNFELKSSLEKFYGVKNASIIFVLAHAQWKIIKGAFFEDLKFP